MQHGLRALGLGLAFVASGALAAVGVNKTFNPTNVSAGQTSTLTVILLNNNASPATAVAFTDNLPGTVVVATPANTTTSCGATVTATSGAANFSVSGGTIPAASGGIAGQCTVTVDVMSPSAGVFINNIPAGAVSSSQGTNPQNANATLTVAALQPVTGAKAFLPATLHGGGGTSTVTLTLTNPNGVALTNASLTDTLPVASLAIAAPPNATTTCGAGAVGTGANTATLTGGTIPANGSCTIKFDVVAANPNVYVDGNVANTIPIGALSTTQGVTNAVAFAANVRLQTGARVEKVFAPTPITTGGTSTLTVTVRNFNTTPLVGSIAFTDTFPAGMSVAAPVVTGTTCVGLAFTPVPVAGNTAFTVSGGGLPGATAGSTNNANCTVTINVTATNAGANPITLNNTIPVGNFGGVGFSSGTGSLVVNAVTSVGGSKSFAPTPILQGGVSTLTITLTNSAAVAANITSFTDALTTLGASPQFTVAAAPPATTTCGGAVNAAPGATSITLGPPGNAIPAGGNCTITVPVQASATASTGARTNSIAQGALVTSQGRTQAAITGVLTVNPVLSVAKAFAPLTVAAGTDTRATITLTRAAGAVALSGLAFTDTLPAGHLVSATPNLVNNCGGAVTATSGTNTITLAGGALAGGAGATSCTILVNVTTPAGAGSGTNTIAAGAVSSTQGFVNPAAASATVTRVVTSVTINKSFNPATVLVGGTSQLTINIINTNANAIALTGGALTDTFPVGMAVAAAPGATNTCGGTFTPLAGATSVSLTNASIAANVSCRVQVNVVANAAGNLINPLAAGAFTSAQGVTNPLPASATLAATGVANLGITKTDGVASVVPGTSTTYTIVASNAGPNAVAGANVVDNPPAGLTFTSWTCVASVGSSCGNASGSGPINELVSLLNAGTATYTVIAAIAPGATGTITNTVTIIVPPTVVDPTPANNTASDTDTLTPVSALAVSKTDGSATYTPGGTATYTVVVTNAGPSNAINGTVSDPLPAGVTLSGECDVRGHRHRELRHGDGNHRADELRHHRRDRRRGRRQFTDVHGPGRVRVGADHESAHQHGDGHRSHVAAGERFRQRRARRGGGVGGEQDRRQPDLHAGRRRDLHGGRHQCGSVQREQRHRFRPVARRRDTQRQRDVRAERGRYVRRRHRHDRADQFRHHRRDDCRRRRQQPYVQRTGVVRIRHADESARQHGDGDRSRVAGGERFRQRRARGGRGTRGDQDRRQRDVHAGRRRDLHGHGVERGAVECEQRDGLRSTACRGNTECQRHLRGERYGDMRHGDRHHGTDLVRHDRRDDSGRRGEQAHVHGAGGVRLGR